MEGGEKAVCYGTCFIVTFISIFLIGYSFRVRPFRSKCRRIMAAAAHS